jgi:capsular polysaccharide biosynthesis protein
MADPIAENNKFDSGSILFFIFKWRKPLGVIGLLAVVLSFIISSPLFITPKYRSAVILYPSASSSISKALLTERSGQSFDILDFGQDSQTEHMLQILNSSRIRNKVTDRFNLMDHYGIAPDHHYRQTRLQREYENNMSFRRTEYMAVKISVMDRDPQMAADIANYIASLVDSVRNSMQKDVAIPGFHIVEQHYFQLRDEIRMKEDSLTKLRQFGVHEYETQAEMINQQLAIEIARNNRPAINALEEKLDILSEYGGAYVSLREQLVHDQKQLSILRIRYEEAKVDAEQILPFKFVVDEAVKAERKSYPIRWLIMVLSTLGALLVGVISIIFLENYKEMAAYVAKQKKNYPESFSASPAGDKENSQESNNKKN